MQRAARFAVVALLAMLVAACGVDNGGGESASSESAPSDESNEEITIRHELGETSVKKNPERVVVFDFGTLDTLDTLGIDVIALPKMNIPAYLSKYEDDAYENVGTLKEPDFEKINALEPDLIIISGRQSELYEEFADIAPTIYVEVDPADYMASFTENVTTIGEIFDKGAEVEEELAKVEEAIQQLHEKASQSGKKALIVLANDDKVSAYGPNSRFGLIHDVFGFAAADENIEVSTHGQSISFEYIVDKDPDVLFVIDRGAAIGEESSAQQVVENELVKSTQAYRDGNIVYLDPDFWYLSGGGLVSVAEMVKEVEDSLD